MTLDVVMKDSEKQGVYFSLFTLPSPMVLYSNKMTLSFMDMQETIDSSPVSGACVAVWLNPQSEMVLATETLERCAVISSGMCALLIQHNIVHVSIYPQPSR